MGGAEGASEGLGVSESRALPRRRSDEEKVWLVQETLLLGKYSEQGRGALRGAASPVLGVTEACS